MFLRSKAKFRPGDLVVYNHSEDSRNEEDKLLHIHSVRYGVCSNIPEKQYWYSGHSLKLKNCESEGTPMVPAFLTITTNAQENHLRKLENLTLLGSSLITSTLQDSYLPPNQ